MIDQIAIRNIKGISKLDVSFDFSESKIIVVTGKNGVGKTTLVKAFKVLQDPEVFKNSSSYKVISEGSEISVNIHEFEPFIFSYNKDIDALDSKDKLPPETDILAELPIPNGSRFKHFSSLFSNNEELVARNSANDYEDAKDLITFLHSVYGGEKFNELKAVKVGRTNYYLIPRDDGTYLREDNFSSGEYFLIQIFRLITSGAKLIIIDELDVALDASAQVRLYLALKSLLEQYNSRLIVISHSLAFMETVDEGCMYYLEDNCDQITLNQRSFGYIKSDLYGFKGFDRYILTEDPVLEEFIEYVIKSFCIQPYYIHKTIGVAGWNQLKLILEKNDVEEIFSNSKNVIAVVDGDAYKQLSASYTGPSEILCSPLDDIELYVYQNRELLLPSVPLPNFDESEVQKKASKTYWRYLINDLDIKPNQIYSSIEENKPEEILDLAQKVQDFLQL